MTAKVEISGKRALDFAAYRVWPVVSKLDMSWIPGLQITDIIEAKQRVGSERKMHTPDGVAHQRVVQWTAKEYTWTDLSNPLATRFKGTLGVDDGGSLGDNDCDAYYQIEWEWKANVPQEDRDKAEAQYKALFDRGLEALPEVLRGPPKACEILTGGDGVLAPKDDFDLGLSRNPGARSKPVPGKGLAMEWDFKASFPIRRVPERLPVEVLDWQVEFIEFCIEAGALKFGNFQLPSGRSIPYEFNAEGGVFASGKRFEQLGGFLAKAVMSTYDCIDATHFDMLYSPETGLTLCATTAASLAKENVETTYCFARRDRKKDCGATIVGPSLQGRVLYIADQCATNVQIKENLRLIRMLGGKPAGVIVALDCQEKGLADDTSCFKEVEQDVGMPCRSVVSINQVLEHVQHKPELEEEVGRLKAYINTFCSV